MKNLAQILLISLLLLPGSRANASWFDFCSKRFQATSTPNTHRAVVNGRMGEIESRLANLEQEAALAKGSQKQKIYAEMSKLWNERAELGRGYFTTVMQKRYFGEHIKAEAIAMSEKHVAYFDKAKSNLLEVEVGPGGLLRRADGSVLNTWDGREFRQAIFVMDADGRILIYDGPMMVDGAFVKHSSILGGRPVASAGEIQVLNGKIQTMSSSSGHYIPTMKLFQQVLVEMGSKGAKPAKVQKERLWKIN